ncbi:hypothetical protein AAC387_Pa04g1167 [Persea americana]
MHFLFAEACDCADCLLPIRQRQWVGFCTSQGNSDSPQLPYPMLTGAVKASSDGTEGTLVAFSGNDVEAVVEPFFPFSVLFFSSLLFWFCSKGTAPAPSSSQRWCSGDIESTESWILCLQAKLSSLF